MPSDRRDTLFTDTLLGRYTMKKLDHPIPSVALTPINGVERKACIYLKPVLEVNGEQAAEIFTEKKDNSEFQILTPITRSDAKTIIKALRELFDLASEEQQAIDLLDAKMQRLDAISENIAHIAIANVMYENGIRRAVLTPSRIVSGMAPAYTIESDRDQLTYVLTEDPLNERT